MALLRLSRSLELCKLNHAEDVAMYLFSSSLTGSNSGDLEEEIRTRSDLSFSRLTARSSDQA